MLLLHDRLLILPLDAEGRIGQHVVELAALEPVARLAVAQRVAEDDVAGFLVLDQHVRAADRPGFVVVLLPIESEVGVFVLGEDEFLGLRQHTAGPAGRVVDGPEDARPVDVLLAGVDEVRHQADDLARREVVAGLFVGLLVEAHHQVLEQVTHLHVVDAVGMQVTSAIALTMVNSRLLEFELLDLVAEFEPLEDAALGGRETVYVGDEVRRNVLRVAEQAPERKRADVVERVLAVRVCRSAQQAVHGVLRRAQCGELGMLLQDRILGRLEDAIQPSQHNHRSMTSGYCGGRYGPRRRLAISQMSLFNCSWV